VDNINGDQMDRTGQQDVIQASVPTDLLYTCTDTISPILTEVSQGGNVISQTPVLVELLRQVGPLSSKEPEEILRLFVRLGEIYDLRLVDDSLLRGFCISFLAVC